jgi:hypothetical protein
LQLIALRLSPRTAQSLHPIEFRSGDQNGLQNAEGELVFRRDAYLGC